MWNAKSWLFNGSHQNPVDCLGLRGVRFLGIADDSDDIERGQNGRMAPFGVSPVQLSELTETGREARNLDKLRRLGNGQGICDKLLTDPQRGIDGSSVDLDVRRSAFGENRFPEPPFESEVFILGATWSV